MDFCKLVEQKHRHFMDDSMAAKRIIEELRGIMSKGVIDNEIQVTPHTIILSPSFYNKHIKILMAKWGIHYLRTKKVVGDEEMLLQYLMGNGGSSSAGDYTQKQKMLSSLKLAGLGQDQIQILNLMKDWVCSYLLNVMKKINRVHYGLLQPLDLQRALK